MARTEGWDLGYTTRIEPPRGMTEQGHVGGYPGYFFTVWSRLPGTDTYPPYTSNLLRSMETTPDNFLAIRDAQLAYQENRRTR
jgi:hypothetical protein